MTICKTISITLFYVYTKIHETADLLEIIFNVTIFRAFFNQI